MVGDEEWKDVEQQEEHKSRGRSGRTRFVIVFSLPCHAIQKVLARVVLVLI